MKDRTITLSGAPRAVANQALKQAAYHESDLVLPVGMDTDPAALSKQAATFAEKRTSIFCVYLWAWSTRTWDLAMKGATSPSPKEAVEMLQPLCLLHTHSTGNTRVIDDHPRLAMQSVAKHAGLRAAWNAGTSAFDWTRNLRKWKKAGQVRRVKDQKANNIRHEVPASALFSDAHKDAPPLVLALEEPPRNFFMIDSEKRRKPLQDWADDADARPAGLMPVHIYFRGGPDAPVDSSHANFCYMNKRRGVARFFEPHNIMTGGHYAPVQTRVRTAVAGACPDLRFEGMVACRNMTLLQGHSGDDLCQSWATMYALLAALNPGRTLSELFAAATNPQALLLSYYQWALVTLPPALGRCLPIPKRRRPFGPVAVTERLAHIKVGVDEARPFLRVQVSTPHVVDTVLRAADGGLDVIATHKLDPDQSPVHARLAALVPWLNHRSTPVDHMASSANLHKALVIRVRALAASALMTQEEIAAIHTPVPDMVVLQSEAGKGGVPARTMPFSIVNLGYLYGSGIRAAHRLAREVKDFLPGTNGVPVLRTPLPPACMWVILLCCGMYDLPSPGQVYAGLRAMGPAACAAAIQDGWPEAPLTTPPGRAVAVPRTTLNKAWAFAAVAALRVALTIPNTLFAMQVMGSWRGWVQHAGPHHLAIALLDAGLAPRVYGPRKGNLTEHMTAVAWETMDGLAYRSLKVASHTRYRPSTSQRKAVYLCYIRRVLELYARAERRVETLFRARLGKRYKPPGACAT